jgi:hypothetical protein
MSATEGTPRVYAAIAAVMAELAKAGISKDRSNSQQGYKFRGIDDVYNALSPALALHNLCMLPRILSREVTERTTQKGNALFYVVVEAEFDLISTEDGTKHTVRTYGEAMDSADKATNKAMSAAYKYAAMQAFAIPTEGDNDADSTTHEVAPRKAEEPKQLVKVSREAERQMRDEVDACSTVADLELLWHSPLFKAEFNKLHKTYQDGLVEQFRDRKAFLVDHPPSAFMAEVAPDFDKMPA